MKRNKLTVVISVALCLLLIASAFTACSFKKEDGDESTTLAPGEDWGLSADETYQPVELESVELAAIVSKALGEEAQGFNGKLSDLSESQLDKVKKVAEEEGYIVDTNDKGDTVIKKNSNLEVTAVNSEKESEILSEAGVKNTTRLSREDYEKVSKAANDRGATAVTDEKGNVTIVETTVVTTKAQSTRATAVAPTTKAGKSTTAPSGSTAGTTKATTRPTAAPTTKSTTKYSGGVSTTFNYPTVTTKVNYKVDGFTIAAANTYGDKNNVTFTSNAAASDGSVAVGNISGGTTLEDAVSSIVIAKYKENGKKAWSDTIDLDDLTMFEDVAVLTDGSIIAVGDSNAQNLASDSQYRCKGTTEAFMIKYSSSGKQQWVKIFGGSGGDMFYAVAPTSDGGFVVGGKSDSKDADLKGIDGEKIKAFVAKFNANGEKQWISSLSGTRSNKVIDLAVTSSDTIYAIIESSTYDGDYASMDAAKNGKKFSVVEKLDPAGKILWTKDFYESGAFELKAVAAGLTNGCVVAGSYRCGKGGNSGSLAGYYNGGTSGTYDGIIIKLDATGKVNWMETLVGFESDQITGIAPVKGGYIFCGFTTSTNRDFAFTNKGDYDWFLGTITDMQRKGTTANYGGSGADRAMNVCSNGDNVVYCCGATYSSDGDLANCEAKSNGSVTTGFNFKYDVANVEA